VRSLTFGCTLVLALAACSRPAQTPGGPIAVVTIVATDYAFAAPDTIPSGLTTFKMVNQGREPHQAVIMGAAGKTWDELQAAVTTPGPIPAWLRFPGSPGAVVGGDASNATARLAPGNYFIVCFIPSADGVPHVMKGMVRRLVVRAAPLTARAPTPTPQSDILVTLSDYSFGLSTPLTAGTHTIRVENAGPQLHELGIEQLAPGKTLADWQQWAAAGAKGVGPARPVGGLTGPDKGKVGWFTVTLTPGKYLLVCYVPDAKDNKPHIAHGMVQEVTVN
jgi:uncharacterized cupredoxin-like copper-binding protein